MFIEGTEFMDCSVAEEWIHDTKIADIFSFRIIGEKNANRLYDVAPYKTVCTVKTMTTERLDYLYYLA